MCADVDFFVAAKEWDEGWYEEAEEVVECRGMS
jgi:hypothetical protein